MKKTIRLTHIRKEARDVEIEFPVYCRRDLDKGVVYSRIDDDGRKCDIHRIEDGGAVRYEISASRKDFDAIGTDYLLGVAEHASSRQEFDLALTRARAFIQQLGE